MNQYRVKTITEREAQELANLSHCVICVDHNGATIQCAYKAENPVFPLDGMWHIHGCNHMVLPVNVDSQKDWKNKIWIPE